MLAKDCIDIIIWYNRGISMSIILHMTTLRIIIPNTPMVVEDFLLSVALVFILLYSEIEAVAEKG